MTNLVSSPPQHDLNQTTDPYGTLFVPRRQRMVTRLARAVFFPPFVRRADRHLLLNAPWLWATKLHRIAWLSGLLMIVAIVFGRTTPIHNPGSIQNHLTTGVLLIVAAQIGLLIFWLYGSDHYHIERERGKLRDSSGLLEFGSYALSLLLISTSVVLFVAQAQQRIRQIDPRTFSADFMMLSINSDFRLDDRYVSHEVYETYQEFFMAFDADGSVRQFVEDEASYYGGDDDAYDGLDFLTDNLVMSDLIIYRDGALVGDNWHLYELIGHYTNRSAAEVAESRSDRNYYFRTWFDNDPSFYELSYAARNNARTILDIGFDQSANTVFTLSLVLFAVAMQGALLRFVYRHVGLRGMLSVGAYAGLLLVGVWLATGLMYPIQRLVEEVLRPYGGFTSAESDLFDQLYMSLAICLSLSLVLIAYRTSRNITSAIVFTRRRAWMLAVLPFLMIAVPYLLLALLDVNTVEPALTLRNRTRELGFFTRHFMREDLLNTWSLAPLGVYILYGAQFAYLPFIPFLKRQHTRLLALPRR